MKSTLTDQDLIDASAPAMRGQRHGMKPEHFAQPMLDSMRAIADAAVVRAVSEGQVLPLDADGSCMDSPTRAAPPMPRIKPMRPEYDQVLRDEFAGRALTGLLADPGHLSGTICGNYKDYAEASYAFADAMMEARK